MSVYAPLAPPGPDALLHLRWQPGNVFHTSALLAAVADAVTLPYRLAPGAPPGPLGPPLGGCDLHSLAQLLARGTPAPPLVLRAITAGLQPASHRVLYCRNSSAKQASQFMRIANPIACYCGRSPARAAASWASPPRCRARRCRVCSH